MRQNTEETQTEKRGRDPEAPDPAGNPSKNTSPRSSPDPDPERMRLAVEDQERMIAT